MKRYDETIEVRHAADLGEHVGQSPAGEPDPGGLFDLSFDGTDGRRPLVGCAD